ncbi:MAG: 5'/3'-nucleotidase SurE [Isosphaeraceae bacterium]
MQFLLTNDDGIDAPGISALAKAIRDLGPYQVVAPFSPYSSCSHTITTHRPLTVAQRQEGWTAVEGSPADCVRLGIGHLARGVDWVIAGINAGGNLGSDVYHSGTVAAAREAVLQGTPGIAVSHYIARGREIDWDRAAQWTTGVLTFLLARPCPPRSYWSVNLPHPLPGAPQPEIVECPLDPSPLPADYRFESDGKVAHYCGNYHERLRVAGSDVEVCFSGKIAVTQLRLD